MLVIGRAEEDFSSIEVHGECMQCVVCFPIHQYANYIVIATIYILSISRVLGKQKYFCVVR